MKTYYLKAVLIIAFSVACLFTMAQEKDISFGAKGGFNMATFQESINTKSKPGIVAGITVDYNIKDDFFILSGLEYVVKGNKVDGGEGNGDGIDLNYLQLPVHIAYKYELTQDIKLVADIGPYFAYGIRGKIKYKAIGDYEAYDINAFDDGAYKRFDLGLGLGAGIEVSRINIRIGYDHGLSKINEFQSIVDMENCSVAFTVGYKF
jgi:hypothetical protein